MIVWKVLWKVTMRFFFFVFGLGGLGFTIWCGFQESNPGMKVFISLVISIVAFVLSSNYRLTQGDLDDAEAFLKQLDEKDKDLD